MCNITALKWRTETRFCTTDPPHLFRHTAQVIHKHTTSGTFETARLDPGRHTSVTKHTPTRHRAVRHANVQLRAQRASRRFGRARRQKRGGGQALHERGDSQRGVREPTPHVRAVEQFQRGRRGAVLARVHDADAREALQGRAVIGACMEQQRVERAHQMDDGARAALQPLQWQGCVHEAQEQGDALRYGERVIAQVEVGQRGRGPTARGGVEKYDGAQQERELRDPSACVAPGVAQRVEQLAEERAGGVAVEAQCVELVRARGGDGRRHAGWV